MTDPDPPPPKIPESAADFRELAREYSARRRFHEMQAETFARLEAEAGRIAAGMEGGKGALRIVRKPVTDTGNMVVTHRLAISKGRTGEDPFAAAYRAAGFTMKTLAKKLRIPRSLLSMYRLPGGRPCPRGRAAKVKELIGWPDDAAHWPNDLTS